MARGCQIARRRKTRNKFKLEKKGSDESDEDYMVGEDEFDDSEDEYCSSLANDETEENLGEFVEEWVKKKIKNVGRPRKKKTAYSEEEGEDYDDDDYYGAKRRKKRKVSHKKKEDNDTSVSYRQESDNLSDEKPRKKTRASSSEKCMGHCNEKSRKKAIVSYQEETEDDDINDSDEDSDEEFTPDEVDGADGDEELLVTKKNKEVWLMVQEAQIAKGKKRKRNVEALRRNKRKKPKKEQVSRKNNRCRGKEFEDESPVVRRKKKKSTKGRRKSNTNSDPDFVNSGLSDYGYTMSEEEREQIREAGKFCGWLTNSLGTSSSLKMIEEEEIAPSQRKRQERKGKEKVVDMKTEVVKQVCGICLSEEGKRRVRGILNCCSHYFCFACIMEWSKVESRCPLCKQRFATITRTAQANGGHDLKDAVIPIPERDQVYQPSEEELLNLYENLLCSECHQGGDDEFMLLCDLCDSPAHTYCVGLGHEVPQGNWYCDACRPTALASPNAGPNSNLSPVGTVRETFDLNEVYVPETPLTGHSPSSRYSSGDLFSNSGLGAFTVYERRQIQRRIQQLLTDGVASVSGISLSGSRISREGVIVPPQQVVPVQVAPQNVYSQGRLPEYTRSGREVFYPNLSSLRGQELHNQDSTSTDYYLGRLSHNELFGIGHQQIHPGSSRSNTGADASILPNQSREASLSSIDKEQVQTMVKSHLKSLSGNSDLGYNNFKYIARTSTHTILAAIGLEHRWNEVYPVRTRPLMCNHFDRLASRETYPVKGQCSSCFDWFVKNVVKEIMLTRVPILSVD